MGLVNAQQKEVIPLQYDLVHNIDGTFKGLIEVEKDNKRGFYDLGGNLLVPVEYEQIFPVNKGDTIAALRKDDDFFWLNKDYSIVEGAGIQIADILKALPPIKAFNINQSPVDHITEANSRDDHQSVYLPPSYLVDLKIFPIIQAFKNPLRKHVSFYFATDKYRVTPVAKHNEQPDDNFLLSAMYSIRNYFIDGRSEFYDHKNIVIVDKKRNRIMSDDITVDYTDFGEMPTRCNDYRFKVINDTLIEIKLSARLYLNIPNEKTYISEGPVFHYFSINNNKMTEVGYNQRFAFASYVKMDDTYLSGCYEYQHYDDTSYNVSANTLRPAYLRYIKNEIYASHNYKFKSKDWTENFEMMMGGYKPEHNSVAHLLSDIEKYNINWINKKLEKPAASKLAAR